MACLCRLLLRFSFRIGTTPIISGQRWALRTPSVAAARVCALQTAPCRQNGPSCNCSARSWYLTGLIKNPIAPKLGQSRAHESEGSGPGSVRPAKIATREAADAQACAGPNGPDDVGDSIGNCIARHLSGTSSARNRPAPSSLAQWRDGLVLPPLGSRLRGPRAAASPRDGCHQQATGAQASPRTPRSSRV